MKRSFLKGLGLTQEQIDSIMDENGDDIENAKEKTKEKYDPIVEKLKDKVTTLEEKNKSPKSKENKIDNEEIDEKGYDAEIQKLKSELEMLKSSGKTKDSDKDKDSSKDGKKADGEVDDNDPLTKLQEEFNSYKANIELEKINNTKTELLAKELEAKGANPKFIPLLMKEFKIDELEIEGEGDAKTFKGFDDKLKPVQESYSDIFGEVKESGADVANPPKGGQGDKPAGSLLEALEQKYNTK